MGKRREPTEAEKIEAQRAIIKDALDNGKTELDLTTESMDVLREACAIKTLKKLTLRTGKLDTLPKELGQLTALESFHIDGNELVSLPDEIGALDKVHTFYAYRNKFKKIPETFGGMKSLNSTFLKPFSRNSLNEMGSASAFATHPMMRPEKSAASVSRGSIRTQASTRVEAKKL